MRALPLVLLALVALATRPSTAAAATNASCYYPTHFVTTSLASCTSACNTLLASKGTGSVYPETYTRGQSAHHPPASTRRQRALQPLAFLPTPSLAPVHTIPSRRRPLLQVPVPQPRGGG